VNTKPKFSFPAFNNAIDFINTNLTVQLYTIGMTLDAFNKRVDNFITDNAQNIAKHREFIKVQYDHNVTEGCDKGMKGISIVINKDYKIEETCGTSTLIMDNTYYVEML